MVCHGGAGEKLQIRPGGTVALLRAPDRHRPLLGEIAETSGGADVVLLYSRSRAQLERDAGAAIAAVTGGRALGLLSQAQRENSVGHVARCMPRRNRPPRLVPGHPDRDRRHGSALRFRPTGDVGRRSNLPPKYAWDSSCDRGNQTPRMVTTQTTVAASRKRRLDRAGVSPSGRPVCPPQVHRAAATGFYDSSSSSSSCAALAGAWANGWPLTSVLRPLLLNIANTSRALPASSRSGSTHSASSSRE